jgi:hypothetical protein
VGDGDKLIEKNSARRGKKYFVLGGLEQPRQDKNPLYRHEEPNEPTKEGPLSFVLFESPFASVSTVSRDHPSLVYLNTTVVLYAFALDNWFFTYVNTFLSCRGIKN